MNEIEGVASVKGLYGFRCNEKDYLSLNNIESTPNGLGQHIFDFLKDLIYVDIQNHTEYLITINQMKENLENIKFVQVYTKFNDEIKKYIQDYHEQFGLSDDINLKTTDWASFFSQEEGNISLMVSGFKYMIKWNYLMLLSKEISYAYIINLDNNMFEIYYGKNDTKIESSKNRYSHLQHESLGSGYYGLVLYKEIPFDLIKENLIKDLSQLEHDLINKKESFIKKIFNHEKMNIDELKEEVIFNHELQNYLHDFKPILD